MDNTEHIKNLFTGIALKNKDKISAMMGWAIYNDYEKLRLEHLFKYIGMKEGKLLIVGIGIGRNIEVYKKVGFNDIVGIDIAEENINICKRDYPDNKYYILDAENMSIFEDNSFDCVIAIYVLTHIASDEKASKIIKELERVSKDRVIIGQCMDKNRITESGEGGLGGKLRPVEYFISEFKKKTVEFLLDDWSVYSEQLFDKGKQKLTIHKTTYLIMKNN